MNSSGFNCYHRLYRCLIFICTILLVNSIVLDSFAQLKPEKNSDLRSSKTVSKVLTLNPYENIDWTCINRNKANFHTHTKNSDGLLSPHEVVDLYHNAGYKILAITDHNQITYPWTGFSFMDTSWHDRDPLQLGMLDVEGVEWSSAHHTGSFMPATPGFDTSFIQALDTMSFYNGWGIINHPGRYWSIDSVYLPNQEFSVDWYESLFQNYPVLKGLEVFNQGDKHSNDKILWDELLGRLMPSRPVWGFSNDDMHAASQLFRNYNILLMPSLSHSELRNSLNSGAFWFSYEPSGSGNALSPHPDSITVSRFQHTIVIHAGNLDSIHWISGITGSASQRSSRILATGDTFYWNNFHEPYIRATLFNSSGITFTQAFGFDFKPPEKPDTIYGPQWVCANQDTFVFYVAEDGMAERYYWMLPPNANLIGSSSGNKIKLTFSSLSSSGQIMVWKENLSGFSDTCSLYVNVTQIPPKPLISLIGNQLVSSASSGNQWFDQSGLIIGAVNQSYTPICNGRYYVMVNNAQCFSEPSDTFSFNSSIKHLNLPAIFYNYSLSDGTLYINLPSEVNSSSLVSIYSTAGNQVFVNRFNENQKNLQINTSYFKAGVYLISIEKELAHITFRIVIK